jgi:hypothetical protein
MADVIIKYTLVVILLISEEVNYGCVIIMAVSVVLKASVPSFRM